MQSGTRYSSVALLSFLLMCFCASSSAQQIRFEDFSNTNFARQYLQMNGSQPGVPSLATWQDAAVLRLTNGGADNPEASSAYFQDGTRALGLGQQPVTMGFTTWFQFQAHSAQCCTPGDGFAFIVQQSTATDSSYGASGSGYMALGAGGAQNQAGAMGYAGINNSLAIEFDILQNAWDPNSNHIAIQTCGPNTNTPVHNSSGDYIIGDHQNVPNCLYSSAIFIPSQTMGPICNDETCMDGSTHDVVIGYTQPNPQTQQPGKLQIWIDPTFLPNTHTPTGPPNISVPYNIVYDAESNPDGLSLIGGSAWVGFTASQPDDGTALDIRGWEFTPQGPTMVQQVIQNGGTPTVFAFGSHETTVTYPTGFMNNGTLMTVVATPTPRSQFYQSRLIGTQFANEQCVAYEGVGTGMQPVSPGTCLVYSYSCQDSMQNPVACPMEPLCTSPQQSQCIAINTTFYTTDNVTQTNADYLENDMIGDNNWMSIFTMYQSAPIDGQTSGGSRGFGGGGGSGPHRPSPSKRKFLTGSTEGADIVATFRPSQP